MRGRELATIATRMDDGDMTTSPKDPDPLSGDDIEESASDGDASAQHQEAWVDDEDDEIVPDEERIVPGSTED